MLKDIKDFFLALSHSPSARLARHLQTKPITNYDLQETQIAEKISKKSMD